MQYAIDRIITGLEKEVSAADFDDQYYIPRKSERFFCPECGLQVSWVTRTANRSSFFRHPTRTETSPECDKRVDGRSELYLYERVGLPVFLTRPSENSYQLAISFPAVGSKMLANGAAQNARVIIRGNGTSRTISINTTNFYPDSATLVPVNFLPSANSVFKIEVSPGSIYSRKWSNYAEGFTSTGAIFTYDETGGKKIHRDDSISPGRQYYVVARQFSCPFNEVHYNTVGTLRMKNCLYQVYCMTVNVSLQNEQRYSQISTYFRSRFGVGLLETAPEIIPLWPPVVERDVLVPAKESRIYCAITSGNADPTVYSYVGNQVLNIPVQKDWNGEKHIYVKAGVIDTVLSVDRKYVGREIVFRVKDIVPGKSRYEFFFMDSDGNTIPENEMSEDTFHRGGMVSANAKMELFLGSFDHNYLHVSLRSGSTLLPTFQNLQEILLSVDGSLICSHCLQTHLKMQNDEKRDVEKLSNSFCGEYIPVPRWAFQMIDAYKRKGEPPFIQDVLEYIVNGRLPIGIIKSLERIRIATRSDKK